MDKAKTLAGSLMLAFVAPSHGILDLSKYLREGQTNVWSGLFTSSWLPASLHPTAMWLNFSADGMSITAMALITIPALLKKRRLRKRGGSGS